MAHQLISFRGNELVLDTKSPHEDLLTRSNKPVKVITVCGKYRTGKSTLLNTWFGDQTRMPFDLGHTTDAKTFGIWMEVIDKPDTIYVLLDTEGWDNTQRNQADVWLALIACFISDEFVMNVKSVLDDDTIRKVATLLLYCNQNSKKVHPNHWTVPHLSFILRDFETDFEEGETSDGYLQRILSSNSQLLTILNRYTLNRRRCYTMSRPHRTPKFLGRKGKDGRLITPDEEFYQEAELIWGDLVKQSGVEIPGRDWLEIVKMVTNAIEGLRRSDPEGEKFHIHMQESELLKIAKDLFTDRLVKLNVVTDVLKEVYSNNPLDQVKVKQSITNCLKAVQNELLVDESSDFNKKMSDLADVTEAQILMMNGGIAREFKQVGHSSLEASKFRLNESLSLIAEDWRYSFYLNQQRHLCDKAASKWPEELNNTILEKDKQECDNKAEQNIHDFLQVYNFKMYGEDVCFVDAISSWIFDEIDREVDECLQEPHSIQHMGEIDTGLASVREILKVEVNHNRFMRSYITTYFFCFGELQSQFYLLDIPRDLLFSNLLDVYNCHVRLCNSVIAPLLKTSSSPAQDRWTTTDLDGMATTFRTFCQTLRSIKKNVEDKIIQSESFTIYLERCQTALEAAIKEHSSRNVAMEHLSKKCSMTAATLEMVSHFQKLHQTGNSMTEASSPERKSLFDQILPAKMVTDDNSPTVEGNNDGEECYHGDIEFEGSFLQENDTAEEIVLDFGDRLASFGAPEDLSLKTIGREYWQGLQFPELESPHVQELLWPLIKFETETIYMVHLLNHGYSSLVMLNQAKLIEIDADLVFGDIASLWKQCKQNVVPLLQKDMTGVQLEEGQCLEICSSFEVIWLGLLKYRWGVDHCKEYRKEDKSQEFGTFKQQMVEWAHENSSKVAALKGIGDFESLFELFQSRLSKSYEQLDQNRAPIEQGINGMADVIKTLEGCKIEADNTTKDYFEKRECFLRLLHQHREKKLKKNPIELMRRSSQLCEYLAFCHQESWVRRYHTLHKMKGIVNDLNSMGFKTTIVKDISMSIAAVGQAMVERLELPGLIAYVAGLAVTEITSVFEFRHLSGKKQTFTTLLSNLRYPQAIENSFNEIFAECEHSLNQLQTEDENNGEETMQQQSPGHETRSQSTQRTGGRAIGDQSLMSDYTMNAGEKMHQINMIKSMPNEVRRGVWHAYKASIFNEFPVVYEQPKLSNHIQRLVEMIEKENDDYAGLVNLLKFHLYKKQIEMCLQRKN